MPSITAFGSPIAIGQLKFVMLKLNGISYDLMLPVPSINITPVDTTFTILILSC